MAHKENLPKRFTDGINTLFYHTACERLCPQTLWLKRIRLNLTFVFTIFNALAYFSTENLSFKPPSKYSLPYSGFIFKVVTCPTTLKLNCFNTKYKKLWNNLPISVIRPVTLFTFAASINKPFTNNSLSVLSSSLGVQDMVKHNIMCP